MTTVVDIYALPVPARKLQAYRRMSRMAGRFFRRHGVTEYREFVFTGAAMPQVPVKAFTGGIKLKPGEVLVTAIVGYPSRAARKRINKEIEADPEFQKMPPPAEFDMKRMTVSTFETIVEV